MAELVFYVIRVFPETESLRENDVSRARENEDHVVPLHLPRVWGNSVLVSEPLLEAGGSAIEDSASPGTLTPGDSRMCVRPLQEGDDHRGRRLPAATTGDDSLWR